MDKGLISIIVPLYNSEEYIDRCLTSLIDQIYENIEIIIVNDGSTDASLTKCLRYKKMDSRINIINQKNHGRSVARNIGIKNSHGEFIMFVDSDDFVSKNFCSSAISMQRKEDADIVLFDYYSVSQDRKIRKRTVHYDEGDITKEQAMISIISSSFLPMKMIKRSLFRNILFPIGKDYEDIFVAYKILDHANKFTYLSCPTYYYVQRTNSITHTKNLQSVSDYFEANMLRFNFLKQNYNNITKYAVDDLKVAAFFYLIYNPNGVLNGDAKQCLKFHFNKHNGFSNKLLFVIKMYGYYPRLIRLIVKNYFN